MPVFHPTLPSMGLKPMYRIDPAIRASPPTPDTLTAPNPAPGAIGNDKSIAPAAPPSAVQMQIMALISEQTTGLETEKATPTDG